MYRCTKQGHQKPLNSKDDNSEKHCTVTVNPWHMKKDCKVLNELRRYCYINIHMQKFLCFTDISVLQREKFLCILLNLSGWLNRILSRPAERKHEPMNLTSSVMVCSWEQPDQCQSLCSHWLGACMFPGMIFEICHPSRAFAVGWEYRFWMTSLYAKVHTLWEVLCTYAEILHIKLPLKSNDLKTRSSAFDNFSCFMKVLQVDESIIKPEQEFFIALFEKSCVNDFYIQDRDTFFNPATRSRIEEERVPFTTWGKCIHITLCASAFFWVLLTIASVIGIIVYGLSVFIVFSAELPKNLNGRDPIQKYLTVQVGHAHHCFPHQFYHHRDPERHI
ncbi:uncharacterized protein LOC116661728 isoform X1 [Camelus ferus]|uniref:Uncharacterized protein LOC116661728 isoform X1 n=1 Tax=Camelus ferus TaxID=419612 RepID=A0A8B8SL69_CAMFR|nr:uncharacterized protein LOC116661728 isoform X1 [Camelus ferus]